MKSRRYLRSLWAIFLAATFLVAFGEAVSAARKTLPEYEAKAKLLLAITRYVAWPEDAFASPDAPIVLGIWGEDPFGRFLDREIAGKTRGGRPFELRRLERLTELEDCHILFVSATERERQGALLKTLGDRPVLTVGETDDFLDTGGGIRILIADGQMRYDINRKATRGARLRIEARLLGNAREIRSAGLRRAPR